MVPERIGNGRRIRVCRKRVFSGLRLINSLVFPTGYEPVAGATVLVFDQQALRFQFVDKLLNSRRRHVVIAGEALHAQLLRACRVHAVIVAVHPHQHEQ
jgi:hypothetical protein